MSLIYLNGVYLPPEEARIPVTDRGLAYGDGVFTTIGVFDRVPRFLAWHLERLECDAAALYIKSPPAEQLADACRGLVSRLEMERGVVKITVTRGVGGRGPSVKNTGNPTVIMAASDLPQSRSPLRTITVADTRGPLAAHKTLNYLPNILALRQAEAAGCDEALFVRDGLLVEATISNLVGFDGEGLVTPSLDDSILDGVVRRALLEFGAVREGKLSVDTDGPLYCINNVRGVEVVAEVNGRPLIQDQNLQSLLQGNLEDFSQPAALD